MGKLIVHVGNAKALLLDNIEVLGSLLNTPAEMSMIGSGLRPSNTNGPRQVFTNSDHIINGLRLAVKHGDIDHRSVEIRFYQKGTLIRSHHRINIDADGNFDLAPQGFMDQASADLLQLF